MTSPKRRSVIVVGGGISGLTAAWRLRKAGVDVALLEAQPEVGGCMQSEHRDGFLLEKGPFNVLVRDDAFHELLAECAPDIGPITAAPEANARYVLKRGQLMKVPMGPLPLLTSPLLSLGAKIRVLLGMVISRRADKAEPTIAEAAERRLGAEVADTFISSIVAGIFGGDSRKLSLKACFPNAWRFDQDRLCPLAYEMSVLKAKKKKLAEHPERAVHKGLIGFRDGLQSLPEWMAAQLVDDAVTNCRVESIQHDDEGYTLTCTIDGESHTFSCRRLLLASPAAVTGNLLRPHLPAAAEILDSIESASLVMLNLGYRRSDVGHPMEGYGFLVPASEADMPVMGVLWADSAFPHHARQTDRVIRVFMGGPRDPNAAERSDEELLATATEALRGLLDLKGEPTLIDICRWPNSIPQYHLGHTDKVDRLLDEVAAMPGLHLAGNYMRGVSINDCIREATRIASEIVEQMSVDERPHSPAQMNGTAARAAETIGTKPSAAT